MTEQQPPGMMDTSRGDSANLTIEWKDVDTVVVDSVVGFVTVGGLPRITLGQISYKPGGANPRYVPVVTIATPIEALRFLAAQLNEIANQNDGAHGGGEDEQPEA